MKRGMEGVAKTIALSWRLFAAAVGARYRNAFLGYFWMVCPAVLITGGVSLASQSGVINPGNTRLPYPLFVFLGVIVWQVFAEAVKVPHVAFDGARAYLTKVHFAHEALILAQLYESLIGVFVRFTAVLLLVAWYGESSWRGIGLLALCLAGSNLLGLGLGAMLMPFTMLFADLQNAVKLILGYGLFLTPAFYVPESAGLLSSLVQSAPVAPLMNSARDAAAGAALSQPDALAAVLALSLLMTMAGMAFVRLSAPIVIERLLLGGR